MNILPIIFALLIILGISSSCFLQQRKDSKRFTSSYDKSLDVQRTIQIKTTEETLKKLKSDEGEKPAKKTTSGKEEKKPYSRQSEKSNDRRRCAKLNLFPLLSLENPEEDIRYQLFVDFIKKYYKDAVFFKNVDIEKTAKNLLESILRSAKIVHEKNDPIYPEKLHLQNSSLQKIYYKLLKGSPHYEFQQKKSLPSLIDFIAIDPYEYQKMCFTHLSKELLSIMFNEKITENIYEAYQSNPRITIKLLEEILTNNHEQLDTELRKILDFTHVQSKTVEATRIIAEDSTKKVKSCVNRYIDVKN